MAGVFGMVFVEPDFNFLFFLLADRAQFGEFLIAFRLRDMKLKIRINFQIFHLLLRQIGTENGRQRLSFSDHIPKLNSDGGDTSSDQGKHASFLISIRLHGSRRAQLIRNCLRFDFGILQFDPFYHFRRKRFEEAAVEFQQAIQLRREAEAARKADRHQGEGDGPSLFYLAEIAKFKQQPPTKDWDGEVELDKK